MESLWGIGVVATRIRIQFPSSPNLFLPTRFHPIYRRPAQFTRTRTLTVASLLRGPQSVSELAGDEVLLSFLKERELKGDFIAKVCDKIWLSKAMDFVGPEASIPAETTRSSEELFGDESEGGFLKLTKTNDWLSGDYSAPINRKMICKESRTDNERWKRLNLLKYEADLYKSATVLNFIDILNCEFELKRELLLLTLGIGVACGGYCLFVFSVQAAVSYWTGMLFSCLYLQLLYQHTDSLSNEMVPQVFMQKKSKKIGIRSQDLQNLIERSVKGSGLALSSPRLVIPVAIYGLWELSQHFARDFFDFQLVPAMLGMFAYKAAALIQVYRDNEDLQLIFPESGEDSND